LTFFTCICSQQEAAAFPASGGNQGHLRVRSEGNSAECHVFSWEVVSVMVGHSMGGEEFREFRVAGSPTRRCVLASALPRPPSPPSVPAS
jgi:hypothetical protein